MLGSLKKLFFKDTGEDLATSIPEPVAIAPAPNWSAIPANAAPPVAVPESAQPSTLPAGEMVSSELLSLPLSAIFARLPNSLAAVVQSQGNGFVSLPVKKIVQELPKGSVKIPFGELRQSAPPGVFFDNARLDQVLVELPLDEILTRLNPSLLARRPDQKQIHIAPEITDVFGPHGEGISLSTSPISAPKMTGDTATLKRGDTSTTRRSDTSLFPRSADAPDLRNSPTAAVPLSTVAAEPQAIEPGEPVVVPLTLLWEGWPEMVRVEIRELNLINAPVFLPLDQLGQALRTGKIVFTWKQICGWMKPPVTTVSGAQDAQVELPLKIITPLFMAKYRAPKVQQKLSVAEIPDLFAKKTSDTEPAAAASQPAAAPKPAPATAPIAFTRPVAPVAPVTPVAPVVPVTPVQSAPVPAQPSPISPAPAPIVPGIALPKLEMKPDNITPLPKMADTKPAIVPEQKPAPAKGNSIGEIFGQPAKTNWPPAEVLKNLVTLPGVTGAFLAMTDGLLVAAELPAQFKAETLAAFLPQIFGRMNQYTKELQLGGLSSLTFVVNEVSWQVVKSGAVYLVALSKTGETLPSANLNTIAAELGKQIQ